ncbi:Hypothetical_protein [Hexamita inflata]|uniref:Hypothetical_protein n=1 Tax=Hexamita inflata TaxID=28002 RepID=A0ABP1GJM0_9EUKA
MFKYLNQEYKTACNNNILINSNSYSYCQKLKQLNNQFIENSFYLGQKSGHMFIFAEQTQKSQINISVSNIEVSNFALFGLNLNNQSVQSSLVNVTLNFQVLYGALLCLTCDVTVFNSSLIFIASGQQISAVLHSSQQSIDIQQTFIQFRFTSAQSAGICNIINTSLQLFQLLSCKMSGFNLQQSINNNYISSIIMHNTVITLDLTLCVQNTATSNANLSSNSFILSCDICQDVVYGICSTPINFSQIVNGMYMCVHPFVYESDACVCKNGFVLVGLNCFDVVGELQNVIGGFQNMENQVQNVKNNLSAFVDLQTQINQQIKQNIVLNVSELNNSLQWRINNTQDQLNAYIGSNDVKVFMMQNNISNTNVVLTAVGQQLNKSIADQNTINQKFEISLADNITQVNNSLRAGMLNINNSLQNYIISNNQRSVYIESNISNIYTMLNNANNTVQQVNQSLSSQLYNTNNSLNNYMNNTNQTLEQVLQNISTMNTMIISLQNQINWLINKPENSSNFTQFEEFNINHDSLVCNQIIFTNKYDFNTVTYQINSTTINSIFANLPDVKNAFINLQSNTYSTQISPLFSSQQQFYNIKIQLSNEQTTTSGSILSQNQQITINQLYIKSQRSSSITISTNNQLNIIQENTTNTNIYNLKIDLNITLSFGNISLIGTVKGTLQVQNYEIKGYYATTSVLALISIITTISNVTINSVNFQPSLFNAGNQSSYFFSYVSQSNLNISNVVVVMGSIVQPVLLNSINGIQQYYYSFGGLIQQSIKTISIIQQIIFDCSLQITAQYINKSGVLVGSINNNQSSLQMYELCIFVQFSSQTKFYEFGLIGHNEGLLQLFNSQMNLNGSGLVFDLFGTFGEEAGTYLTINNYIVIFTMKSTLSSGFTSAVIGRAHQNTAKADNIMVLQSNITGTNIGGIIGHACANLLIQNCSINNSYLSSIYLVGGLIGQTNSLILKINNSITLNTVVYASSVQEPGGSGGIMGTPGSGISLSTFVEVIQCSTNNSIIISNQATGGLIAHINATINIVNSLTFNTSVKGIRVGGLIGRCNQTSNISNAKVESVNVTGIDGKIFLGYISTTNPITIIDTLSMGQNYINDVLQLNCPSYTNITSSTGC